MGPNGREFAGNNWFFPDLAGEEHGIPLLTQRESASGPPKFSPDGQFVAWGTNDGVVVVANIPVVRKRLDKL